MWVFQRAKLTHILYLHIANTLNSENGTLTGGLFLQIKDAQVIETAYSNW